MKKTTNGDAEATSPIELAIDAAGGLTELARRVGELPQTIVNWRKRRIPPDRILDIEEATRDRDRKDRPIGKPKVTRHQLAPKQYPLEKAA